jgi:hypothetical protein
VDRIEAADDGLLERVRVQCCLPLGWQLRDGKPVSPWAPLGEKSVTQSFYYLSRHHDPIRERSQGE